MDCTIAALIACFSWSNFYVDGGLSYHDAGPLVIEKRWVDTYVYVSDLAPDQSMRYEERPYRVAANPYGRLSIGYQVELQRVTFSVELSHISSLDTNKDRGVNSVAFKARWFPFR